MKRSRDAAAANDAATSDLPQPATRLQRTRDPTAEVQHSSEKQHHDREYFEGYGQIVCVCGSHHDLRPSHAARAFLCRPFTARCSVTVLEPKHTAMR
jgi:hypothetical protein